jgi:hypothetical protein
LALKGKALVFNDNPLVSGTSILAFNASNVPLNANLVVLNAIASCFSE